MGNIKYRRIYNILKIHKLMVYYKESEWNTLDILFRLITHKFYTDEEERFILIYKDRKYRKGVYLSVLGVNPKYYGSGLTDKIFKDLTNKGKLVGHISVNNTYSINMAKRNGFKIKGEVKYYKNSNAYIVEKDG